MTERVNHATERSNEAVTCALKLLHHYGFDLGDYMLSQLLSDWQQHYPTAWIRLATIEALYQGRYKAISVEQILAMWQRRNQPLPHFNHEFERLVCNNLPEHQVVIAASTQREPVRSRSAPLSSQAHQDRVALQLPSFEGSPLPEADVMLALRTLHSKEMAVLQEAALAEAAPTEAAQQPKADDHPPTQTYSYSLRSNEPASPTAAHESSPAPTQSEEDQPIHSDETTPSETVASQGIDGESADMKGLQVNGSGLPEEPIASLSSQTDNELDSHQTTETPVLLTSPLSEAQAPLLPPIGAIAKILQQLEHQELKTKAELPTLGLIASRLKPKLSLHLATPYQPTWLADPSQNQPIHQFTPTLEPSAFCSKLKAVAQPMEEPPEDVSQPDS